MAFLLVVSLIVLWPLIVRAARFLFVAHAWLVVLFLPAGLLVRHGPSQDMRIFVAVSCVWALTLFACRIYARTTRARSGPPQR